MRQGTVNLGSPRERPQQTNAANIANIIASGKEEVFGQQQDIDDRIMEHAKLILRQNAEEINADTERMWAQGMKA